MVLVIGRPHTSGFGYTCNLARFSTGQTCELASPDAGIAAPDTLELLLVVNAENFHDRPPLLVVVSALFSLDQSL